jgi:hypothetical protein
MQVDEKTFTMGDGLEIMANGYAICQAMVRLIDDGDRKTARHSMRRLWKVVMTDKEKGNSRHAVELVLDQFFNHDGDMHKAVAEMKRDLLDTVQLGEPTRQKLVATLDTMTKMYVAKLKEWAE